MIKLRHLERRYPLGKEKFFYVLRDINLDIAEGEFVSVMGHSGAGKSTLLKLLALDWKPVTGEVKYNGVATHFDRREKYATTRAVLSQQIELAFPMQVNEVVLMGRYPYFQSKPAKRDLEITQECMRMLDVQHL